MAESLFEEQCHNLNPSTGEIRHSLQNHRAKITPAQREEIHRRANDGENIKELALEFHVSASYVRTLKG